MLAQCCTEYFHLIDCIRVLLYGFIQHIWYVLYYILYIQLLYIHQGIALYNNIYNCHISIKVLRSEGSITGYSRMPPILHHHHHLHLHFPILLSGYIWAQTIGSSSLDHVSAILMAWGPSLDTFLYSEYGKPLKSMSDGMGRR